MTTPFLYLIGWTALDRWYVGIKYAKGCKPSDLWTRYWTSSKYVTAFRYLHGEPDFIKVIFTGTREQVAAMESHLLVKQKLYESHKWINQGHVDHKFHRNYKTGWKHPDSTKCKIAAYKRTPEQHDRMVKSITGRTLSEEHKRKLSEALKGRKKTAEERARMSEYFTGVKRSEQAKANIKAGRLRSLEAQRNQTLNGDQDP